MDLYEVFNSPFFIHSTQSESNSLFKSKYFRYKTNIINTETNIKEIYTLSKFYFEQFIEKFKNYRIQNENVTESSFNLYVSFDDDDDLPDKHIYSMGYNNILQKVNIENKFTDNISIESNFRVCINISLYVSYEEYNDEYNDDNILIKPKKESECVVCYNNNANILFLDCLHICVCFECNEKGNFSKCPLCRKKIIKEKVSLKFEN